MKTAKLLITLYVFLASFLFVGMALANDAIFFNSVNSNSNLAAPNLTVQIDGWKVTLSWGKVTGATSYVVHYAQKPYDNPDTIKTIDVGDKTSASYVLSQGDAYHVAVKACNASGFYCSDYSIIHDIVIPIVSSFKNSLGQEFKFILAGTFMMGSPSDELGKSSNETQHQVTLTKSF
jgi:formylglycine-generating enzyme required for sulfatase activity